MKKTMLFMFAAAALCSNATAQTWTHFYNETFGQRTVEPVIGASEYVMTETRYDPTGAMDNSIHFTHYDQAGNIIFPDDIIIDEPGVDDRNVDITNWAGSNKFLLTSYYSPVGSGKVYVSNMLIDVNGNIAIPSVLMESLDPHYPNLYAMDAVFDPMFNQYVICGMASKGDFAQDQTKVAFVATVDPNTLTTTNMMFYDSNPVVMTNGDFDMANRIVLNSTGRYYITGSENVDKGGNHLMGIRNMLIDPTTLNIAWSNPIAFNNTYSYENSVDMAETVGASGLPFEFFTLVNSSSNKWYFLRIDPFSGNVLNPFIETVFSYKGWGHNIAVGNNPGEVVISGMKYRAQGGNCYSGDQEATPFMASINVTTPLATFIDHVEYYTVVSNSPYWTLGDLYTPSNVFYAVPVYLNNFADREAPFRPYSVVTPIKGITGNINTKFLDVDPFTKNGCKDLNCQYGLDFNDYSTFPAPNIANYMPPWTTPPANLFNMPISYWGSADCGSGYYREENTTSVEDVAKGKLKIYPNPATDKINIELGSAYNNKNTQISLHDVTGKKIAVLHSSNTNSNTVTLALPANVSAGIYLLQMTADGTNTVTERITITQ